MTVQNLRPITAKVKPHYSRGHAAGKLGYGFDGEGGRAKDGVLEQAIDKRTQSSEKLINESKLASINPWWWVQYGKIKLDGRPWSLHGHEYQCDWLACNARAQCFIKGAQTGASSINILTSTHGLIYGRFDQGVLYLFPTRDDVTDFSKGRFAPLISDNPCIGAFVADTDAANIKRVGKSMLYLRGAKSSGNVQGMKKTSSQLKSIPVDRIVFDEIDEMEPEMIELAKERMSHSALKEERYISTPTIPDYGVDRLYKSSDQRVWMIKCARCNTETCLELEFPECLGERHDGKVIRMCRKCGSEIFPWDGKWVAQYPERSNDLVGWWISQLNSLFVTPTEILSAYKNPPHGSLQEFYNSKLGMAHIDAEDALTINDVYSCLGQDAMLVNHPGPCAMGVDIGKEINVVVVDKPNHTALRIVYCGRVSTFNDIHDIGNRFNVGCAVLDKYPETRKAREFQDSERYSVYLCQYMSESAGFNHFDPRSGEVKCNRTEICDQTHQLFIKPGRLILPRLSEEIKILAKQLCAMVKMKHEDRLSRTIKYRYFNTGPDHYRHALNYAWLASTRIGLSTYAPGKRPLGGDYGSQNSYLYYKKRGSWMVF